MTSFRVEVDAGDLNRLIKKLDELPGKLQRGGLRKAVTAGSTQIVRQARRLVPRGRGRNPDGTPRRHLYQSLSKKTRTYFVKDGAVIVGIIGHKSRETPHAHLVHGGTKPHVIRGWQHPGSRPQPYLERARERAIPDVIRVMTGKLSSELAKLARS